jgi:hypothetical protein
MQEREVTKYWLYGHLIPRTERPGTSITVVMRSKARSSTGIVDLNPTRGMAVCLQFILCLCCPRYMADHPSKEPYQLCTRFTISELILIAIRPECITRQDRRRTAHCICPWFLSWRCPVRLSFSLIILHFPNQMIIRFSAHSMPNNLLLIFFPFGSTAQFSPWPPPWNFPFHFGYYV